MVLPEKMLYLLPDISSSSFILFYPCLISYHFFVTQNNLTNFTIKQHKGFSQATKRNPSVPAKNTLYEMFIGQLQKCRAKSYTPPPKEKS